MFVKKRLDGKVDLFIESEEGSGEFEDNPAIYFKGHETQLGSYLTSFRGATS